MLNSLTLFAHPWFAADIEAQFEPVFTMYSMIDRYLPGNVTLIDKDEQDQRLLLRSSWSKLIDEAQEAQANLQKMQSTYKRELILNINTLKADSKQFREDFVKNGPACPGIKPRLALANPYCVYSQLSRFAILSVSQHAC